MDDRRLLAVSCLMVLALSGCGILDAAHPSVIYQNRSQQDVVVSILGAERTRELTLPAGTVGEVSVEQCVGTAILVQSPGGEFVGRLEKPACPEWILTIEADGSLAYTAG